MQKLIRGVHEFQSNYFASERALFEQLATAGQNPETLFITCSDSRIVPNLITTTAPGELFTVRNVGNIVPQVSMPGGTAAAIEYAVEVLGVTSVIICGHTHCGAIDAIMNPERTANLPFLKKWLAPTAHVRELVASRYADLDRPAQMIAAIQENVLAQLENLGAFPGVAARLDDGRLKMNGWVFEIETGQVFDYNPATCAFEPIAGNL